MSELGFKVGDRVEMTGIWDHAETGMKGVIVCILNNGTKDPFGVRFDEKFDGGHDLGGRCPNGYGHWVSERCIKKINGGSKMKKVWEIIVIDKEKNEVILKEIVIDGDEKTACSKTSLKFSSKLKDLNFDNLHYITRELGSYEEKEKK